MIENNVLQEGFQECVGNIFLISLWSFFFAFFDGKWNTH